MKIQDALDLHLKEEASRIIGEFFNVLVWGAIYKRVHLMDAFVSSSPYSSTSPATIMPRYSSNPISPLTTPTAMNVLVVRKRSFLFLVILNS